ARHRGAVGRAVAVLPRAVAELGADEQVADRRVPAVPTVAARLPHRLHGVVVAVIEVPRARSPSADRQLSVEIQQTALDRVVVVDAGAVERYHARRRARELARPVAGRVTEAAVLDLAALHISGATFDHFRRHMNARVPRRA